MEQPTHNSRPSNPDTKLQHLIILDPQNFPVDHFVGKEEEVNNYLTAHKYIWNNDSDTVLGVVLACKDDEGYTAIVLDLEGLNTPHVPEVTQTQIEAGSKWLEDFLAEEE